MRYIDSGTRLREHALGHWVERNLDASVIELRVQSGFFSGDGLAPFIEGLRRLAAAGQSIKVVVGSNEGATIAAEVLQLASHLGLPKATSKLGIVCYGNAFFHPKTYHLTRSDGSQAAYVGSANLSGAGITGLHVEAGLLLDTRHGDPEAVLSSIAGAVDGWFTEQRAGFHVLADPSDVSSLVSRGLLSAGPRAVITPRNPRSPEGPANQRPSLRPLLRYAGAPSVAEADPAEFEPFPPQPQLQALPSATRVGFPDYVLFAPGQDTPTGGADALSGASLPAAATGLIQRWSRDSDRYWRGAPGTANLSIPVTTATTLRFGLNSAGKPRAEFGFQLRYCHDGGELRATRSSSNVMVYGISGSSHRDVRMPVVKSAVQELLPKLSASSVTIPSAGDMLLVEWPTLASPDFRVTAIDPSSKLAAQVASVWNAAAATNQLLGRNACWLRSGIAPSW